MSRPTDWTPLTSGADPVPGEPTTVARLAKRYADTAAEIQTQVAALHRLADGTDWDSPAGDKFKDKAKECAEKLDQAYDRYDTAGSALHDWVQPLDDAQSQSLKLLSQAQQAHADQLRYAPKPVISAAGQPPPPLTPAQQAAETTRKQNLAAADGALAQAQRSLQNDVVGPLHSTASGIANRIQDVIHHDGLKDSWWDSFRAWVHDNAGWIKVVVNVIGWVATGLAIAALFCTGIGAVLVLSVMAAALAGHLLLAATGNGSWVDVGLDVVGMLTFGLGGVASHTAAEALEVTGAKVASREAVAEARGSFAAEKKILGRQLEKASTPKAVRAAARTRLAQLKGLENAAGKKAATAFREEVEHDATIGSRMLHGDREIAKMSKNLGLIGGKFPGSAKVASAVKEAEGELKLSSRLLHTAYGLDLTRHAYDDGYVRINDATGGHLPTIPEFEWSPGGEW